MAYTTHGARRQRRTYRTYLMPLPMKLVGGEILLAAFEYDHADNHIMRQSVLRQAVTGPFFVNCEEDSDERSLVDPALLHDHAMASWMREFKLAIYEAATKEKAA